MKLHENPQLYRETVLALNTQQGIPNAFIEKDYWLTTVLKKLSESTYRELFVFKGGTSLSKAYNLIQRFSEDVDLALLAQDLSGNQVKSRLDKVSKEITRHLPEIQLEGTTKKWSRFRRTAHHYPVVLPEAHQSQMTSHLVLELNAFGKPYPYQEIGIRSMLADFLIAQGRKDLVKAYELEAFYLQVLSPERTLGEKILAIARASYHADPVSQLQNKIRHAYDLHILMAAAQLEPFLASEQLFETLIQVQADDAASREFQGEWSKQALANALIFADTDELWKELAKPYAGPFSGMVYGELPPLQKVRESIRRLKARLQAFDALYPSR